jgi:hypothetical protein
MNDEKILKTLLTLSSALQWRNIDKDFFANCQIYLMCGCKHNKHYQQASYSRLQ